MSGYAVFETLIVVLVGLASAWQVMNILVPRATQRLRTAISRTLNGGREDARLQPDTGARSGCGVGCGSGCNGCRVAAGLDQSLADQRNPSR